MESFQDDTIEEVYSNDDISNEPKKKRVRLPVPGSCETCGKTFRDKRQLYAHVRIHTGERPYVCHICDRAFNQNSHLKRHILASHMDERPFKCKYCVADRYFKSKQGLEIHIRTHTGEKPYVCPFCGRRFAFRQRYKYHEQLHIQQEESKGSFVCNTCDSKFDSSKHLERHMRIHDGNKPAFLCEICKIVYSRKDHLDTHLKRDHNTAIVFQCDVCEQHFSSKFKLKMHHRLHEPKKKRIRIRKKVKEDIHTVSNQEKTDTPDDSKNENESLVLEKGKDENSTIQTGNIVFKQEKINSSVDSESRSNYFVLGEEEKNEPSTDDKEITSEQILPAEQIPANNRFLCGMCHAEFSNLTEINEHILTTHTDDVKPFMCGICKESFWSHIKLKYHVDSNHNLSRVLLECFLCDQTFSDKDEFKKHFNSCH